MNRALAEVAQVIAAHAGELALPGVLSVRVGWKFRGGWPVDPPEPAVVVTVADKTASPPGGALLPTEVGGFAVDVRQASARKQARMSDPTREPQVAGADPATGALPVFQDEAVPRGAGLARVAPEVVIPAAGKPQLPYEPPAGVALDPVTAVVTVQACASPDAGWPVLKAFLGSVQDTVTIGLYDWTSKHVLDARSATTWPASRCAWCSITLRGTRPLTRPTSRP